MIKINENYLKLQASYLFSEIRKRTDKFHEENPDINAALLGHVSFPDVPKPSEFMRWLEKGGSKYFFDYAVKLKRCDTDIN